MALQCNLTMNVASAVAGQSPAPQATLTVYNPNATAVSVVAVQLAFYNAINNAPVNSSAAMPVPATSPGQTITAPALTSITIGPFPITAGSASANPFWMSTPIAGSAVATPQIGELPITQMILGATVYGSDGSINEAGRVGFTISPNPFPPPTYQGGWLQFNVPNNFVTGLIMGIL